MKSVLKIDSIAKLNQFFGNQETVNPLVTIVDFSSIAEHEAIAGAKIYLDLYTVMLKQNCSNSLVYGRNIYDFQNGTLVFIAPGQVIEIEETVDTPAKEDWGLFFHPDLLFGHKLNQTINDYTFFNYTSNEALHVSKNEKNRLNEIVKSLKTEISDTIDKHSQKLIVSNIELLLNYCTRYFDRQFITRAKINHNVLAKLELILADYFEQENTAKNGLPTVKYIANALHLSPNYLSDLLKKETGLSTIEHIHKALVSEAKRQLLEPSNTISTVAYNLGFEYPQYFTRLFKKQTGITPKAFVGLK